MSSFEICGASIGKRKRLYTDVCCRQVDAAVHSSICTTISLVSGTYTD